jgi:hypothetical protein
MKKKLSPEMPESQIQAKRRRAKTRQLANKGEFLSQCSYPLSAMFRRRLRWVGRIDAGLRKRTAKLVGTRPSFSKRLGS